MAPREPLKWVRCTNRHELSNPMRRTETEQEPDPGPPVMTDEPNAPEFETIEQRNHVVDQIFLGVSARGRIRPAKPAGVGTKHRIVTREMRKLVSPHVPMLRPAVQHDDGIALARARDVDVDGIRAHDAVLHTIYLRPVVAHRVSVIEAIGGVAVRFNSALDGA